MNVLEVLKEVHQANTQQYLVEFAGDVFRLRRGESRFAYFKSQNGLLSLVRYEVSKNVLTDVTSVESDSRMSITVIREYAEFMKAFAAFIRDSVRPMDDIN